MIELDNALQVAKEAATLAGDALKKHHHAYVSGETKLQIDTKKNASDLVTQIDGEVQELVINHIQKHFPDHRFIGEEDGSEEHGDPSSPYTWIIDPLDGTTNFVHKKPNFGTILALQEDDEIILAIIYRPMFDEMFWGAKGKGSFVNDAPAKLRETRDMDDAVLCSNIMHRAKKDDRGHYVTIPKCGSIENYGNAAEEIAMVLLGHTDGVFFDGVGLWDGAPGCFLIAEAGGQSKYKLIDPNDPYKGIQAVMTTEPIFEEVCEFLWGE